MKKQIPEVEKYHLNKNHPEKLQFGIYSLNDYLKRNVGHTNKPHIHSFYQIIWFAEGEGKHIVDFKEYDVSENTIFFVSESRIHHFDDNLDYKGIIIHFNHTFLIDDGNDVNIFLKYNIFNNFESEPFFKIGPNNIAVFRNLVSELRNEIENPDEFAHKDYLKHILNLFLISIQRLRKKDVKELSLSNQSHIVYIKFRQILEDNFRKIHTVSKYAELLHISSKTLTNYTKEICFKTPLEIINERITLEAKRLLTYSGKNINEIGYQLGFEDPSYFVKFFKKQVGKSPGDFRKDVS